jgi:hypothetical protein
MSKLMLTFAIIALGVASAAPKTLHMTLADPVWIGGNQLTAGEYKVEMQGDKALIISGKKQIEVPAKLESNATKYDTSSVTVTQQDNRPTVHEACFGGTTTRIVFSASPTGE